MKIVLENELEKYAWGVMMMAHHKWERKHGNSLHKQMNRYFFNVFKKDTEEVLVKEVERRLREEFGEESFTEDEYMKLEMRNYSNDIEQDLREIHREIQADKKEDMLADVEDELVDVYYTFFNAPEKLTVIYNGEVIQRGHGE